LLELSSQFDRSLVYLRDLDKLCVTEKFTILSKLFALEGSQIAQKGFKPLLTLRRKSSEREVGVGGGGNVGQ